MRRRRHSSSGNNILPLFDGWQPDSPPQPSALLDLSSAMPPATDGPAPVSASGGETLAPASAPANLLPATETAGRDVTDVSDPVSAHETEQPDGRLPSPSSFPTPSKGAAVRSSRPAAPAIPDSLLSLWRRWVDMLPAGEPRPVVALVGDLAVWEDWLSRLEDPSRVEWHVFSPGGAPAPASEAGGDAASGASVAPFSTICCRHATPYGQTTFPAGFFDAVWLLPSPSEIPLTIGEVFMAEGPELRQFGKALHDVRPGGLVAVGLGRTSDRAMLQGKSLAARCLRIWGTDWRHIAGRGGGLWIGCRGADSLDPRLALRAPALPAVMELASGTEEGIFPVPLPVRKPDGIATGDRNPVENDADLGGDTGWSAETWEVYAQAQTYLALRTPVAWEKLVTALGELAQSLGVATPFGSVERRSLSVAACRAIRRHLSDTAGPACRSFVLRLVRAWEQDPDFTLCRGEVTGRGEVELPWEVWIAEQDRNGCPIDIVQLARQIGASLNGKGEPEWLKGLRESGHVLYDPVRQEYVGPRTLTLFRGRELWRWFTHRPEWQRQYPAEWNCLKTHLVAGNIPEVTLELGSNLLPVEVVTGYLSAVAARHGKAFQAGWVQFSMVPGRGREVKLGSGAGMTRISGLFGFSMAVGDRSLHLPGRVVLRALLGGRTPLLYERLERQYARLVADGAPHSGLADAFAALEAHLAAFQTGFREWFASRPEHAMWQKAWQREAAGLRSLPPPSSSGKASLPGTGPSSADVPAPGPVVDDFPGWQSLALEKVMRRRRLFVARSADEGRVEFFIRLFGELRRQGHVERLLYVAPKSLLPLYQSALEEALAPAGVAPGTARTGTGVEKAATPAGSPVVVAGEASEAATALFRFHFGDAPVLLLSHEALGRLYPGLLPEESGIGEWYYQRLAWSSRWLQTAGRSMTPEEMLHLDREYLLETLEQLDLLLSPGEAFTAGRGWEEEARRLWKRLVDEWEHLVSVEWERLLNEPGLAGLRPLLASGAVVMETSLLASHWGHEMRQCRLVVAGEPPDSDRDETRLASARELAGRFNGRYLRQCLEVAQGALFAFATEASRLLREIHMELGEVSLLDVLRGHRCQVVLDEVDLRLRNLPNQDVGKTVFAGLSGLGDVAGSAIGRQVLSRLEVLHRLDAEVMRHVLVLGSNAGMLNSPLEVYNWGKALGVLPPHLESGTDFLFHHVAIGFELERQLNRYAYIPRIHSFLNREAWQRWAADWMEGVSEVSSGLSSKAASSGHGETARLAEGALPGTAIVTCPLVEAERDWLKQLDSHASGSQRQLWLQRISLGTAGLMPGGTGSGLQTGELPDETRQELPAASKIHWLAGLLAVLAQRSPRSWQLVLVDAFAAGLHEEHPFTGALLSRLKELGIRAGEVFLATGTLREEDLAHLEEGKYRIVLGSQRFSLGASQVWRPLAAVHIPWVGYTPQSLYTGWRLLTASRERHPDLPSWLVTYVKEGVDEYLNKHLFRKLEIAVALQSSGALGDQVLRELGPVLSELALRSTQSLEMRQLRALRQSPEEGESPGARRIALARHLLGSRPLELPPLAEPEAALHPGDRKVNGFEVISGMTPAELGQRLLPDIRDAGETEKSPMAPVRGLGQYWLRAPLDDLLLGHLPPPLGGHCLYYGVAYVPVSPSGEQFSPEVRRLAAGFRRLLPAGAEGGLETAVELVLEGWRHIVPATDPERFTRLPAGVFGDGHPSGRENWLEVLLKHFSATGHEPEALRPWVGQMVSDLGEVVSLPTVDGRVFHPWQPTSLTPYAIVPANAAGWYRPVLFICREFVTAGHPLETAGGLSVLVHRDRLGIPPHLVVAVGLPMRGDEAVGRRAEVESGLVRPWESLVCRDERVMVRRLLSRSGVPAPGRIWQVPHLEQVVSGLLAQREGTGESLARRLTDGTVIPPPAWVAERVVGVWAAVDNPHQVTAAGIILGQTDGAPVATPVRGVDTVTGAVAITGDYEQAFTESPSRTGRLSVEPWVAGMAPGPCRTLALAIDLAVWEGAPDAVRQLFRVFSPAEVKAALTEAVWIRWAVTAGWVHGAESSRGPGTGDWWVIRPEGVTSDLHHLLRAHLGIGEPEDVLRAHSHQLALLRDELMTLGYTAAAGAVGRWAAAERAGSGRRSGQVEAAALVADYVEQHGPPAARAALVPAQTREVVSGALALAVWTPSMLNRMERQVVGTGLEEDWEATLERLGMDWVNEVEAHRRRLELLFPGADTTAACQALDVALWGKVEARWQDFEARTAPHCLYGPHWYTSGFQTFVAQTRIREERGGNAPLGAALRRLKRDRSVNYVSTLNTGIMIAGGLEALSTLNAARRRWLKTLQTTGEMGISRGPVPGGRLVRLAAGFPLMRLRHPVWAEVSQRMLSGENWQQPSPGLWAQLRTGLQNEPLRSGTRPDDLVASLTALFPVDWLGWCRPLAWRVGGYALADGVQSRVSTSSLRLTAWQHHELWRS